MVTTEIPQSDFVAWKNDRTTKAIFKYLSEISEYTKESMLSAENIGNPNGLLRLNYLKGYLTAIEDLLMMESVSDEDNREG